MVMIVSKYIAQQAVSVVGNISVPIFRTMPSGVPMVIVVTAVPIAMMRPGKRGLWHGGASQGGQQQGAGGCFQQVHGWFSLL
jgi:hypothetical protein